MFDDDQQTPNDLMAVFEFPNPDGGGDKKKILQFEVRHWITNREGIKSDNPDLRQCIYGKFRKYSGKPVLRLKRIYDKEC